MTLSMIQMGQIALNKPLYYMEPKIYDEPLYRNQYYFTSQMLIAPITKKKNSVMNRVVQKLYIPNGTWYDYFTGKKYNGGKYYTSFYKDEDYPVFCTAWCSLLAASVVNQVTLGHQQSVMPSRHCQTAVSLA